MSLLAYNIYDIQAIIMTLPGRCFLSHKVQQIKQVVDGILRSIYKFHALLRLGHWERGDSGEFIHTEFDTITKAYLPFKEFTQFLNKGTSLPNRPCISGLHFGLC